MTIKIKTIPVELFDFIEYRDGQIYWLDVGQRTKHKDLVNPIGYRSKCTYKSFKFEDCSYYIHRVIYAMHNNGECPDILDHINGDKHDNRIENLRPADRQGNRYNSKSNQGVYFNKRKNKWQATATLQIDYVQKRTSLGYYEKHEDALLAGWLVRHLFKPGFVPVPELLQSIYPSLREYEKQRTMAS